jgi:hypothetical protein
MSGWRDIVGLSDQLVLGKLSYTLKNVVGVGNDPARIGFADDDFVRSEADFALGRIGMWSGHIVPIFLSRSCQRISSARDQFEYRGAGCKLELNDQLYFVLRRAIKDMSLTC